MRLSLLHKLEGAHEDSVWSCAWSPDSSTLATGSVDESVKLWQETADALEQKHHLMGLTLGVVAVAFDPSGSYGAATSLDSVVSVWSMGDYNQSYQIHIPPSEAWGLAFAPSSTADALTLAVAGGCTNTVKLWSAAPGVKDPTAVLEMPAGDEKQRKERFVLSLAYSPDGRRLAAGGMDGTVAVFDTAAGKLLHTLDGHFRPVRSLAFTPDSKFLLTACDDAHAHLYDVEQAALVEAFSGHESWVLSVAANPDGTAFATGSSDSKIKLWDLQTRTCAQTLTEHEDQVWGVAFRPDGSRLASVSEDRSVCLWDFS